MSLRAMLLGCFLLLIPGAGTSQRKHTPSPPQDNKELYQLYMDDQHERGNEPFIEYDDHGKRITPVREWKELPDKELSRHDEVRRKRVREMLDAGTVRTGQDYFFASMIFQHGEAPNDFLLAHVLAMAAVSKGYQNARWTEAATLDRYLQSMKQPQVFGTQFLYGKGGATSGDMSQGEYDSNLISNSVRAAMCVIPREKQEAQLNEARKNPGKANFNTGLIPCP